MEFRNTAWRGGLSPAQVLYGHPTKTLVPVRRKNFDSKWSITRQAHGKCYENKVKANEYHNEESHPLSHLSKGYEVVNQDTIRKKWIKIGTIIIVGKFSKYFIKTSSGQSMWRNRKHPRLVNDELMFLI